MSDPRVPQSSHIVWHQNDVTRSQREAILGQRGQLVWLTGLSASGKSTIAAALEARLTGLGRAAYLLDGDNIRHGLCDDLGFSQEHRVEHIRRIGEVGRLFVDAGLITIAAFISPYQADRDSVRAKLAPGDFVEIHISTPLEVCEQRDPKGLYASARRGEIPCFTGISAPYEAPENPDLRIDASEVSCDDAVDAIVAYLEPSWSGQS